MEPQYGLREMKADSDRSLREYHERKEHKVEIEFNNMKRDITLSSAFVGVAAMGILPSIWS